MDAFLGTTAWYDEFYRVETTPNPVRRSSSPGEGADHASVIVELVQPKAAGIMSAAQQRSHARKLRSYAVELCFYERYASRCGEDCRVARTLLCEQGSEH